eukprot:gene2350-3092_t
MEVVHAGAAARACPRLFGHRRCIGRNVNHARAETTGGLPVNETIYTISTWVIPAILAITLHEAAHGFVALRFGDRTAWQQGRVPLSYDALMRAIELNAVAVENNKTAFEWGRQAAVRPEELQKRVRPGQIIEFKKRESVESLVARRVEFLTGYQEAAYAGEYKQFVGKVQRAEAAVGKSTALTEAV